MNRIHAIARKYGTVAAVSVRDRMAYFSNYAGTLVTYCLFIFVFSRIWTATYANQESICGYDKAMSIWYFIIAEIPAFGFGRFYWSLSRDMKSGQVAYTLGRPYSFVMYNFSERMGPALLDVLALSAAGLAMGTALVGPPPVQSPAHGMVIMVSILLSGSLQFFLHFAIAMTAFWLEENAAFFWIYQKLALVIGTLIPLEFLPDAIRKVALWTPFPYASYAPARIAVAFSAPGAIFLIGAQVAWLVFGILVCRALYGAGSRSLSINGG